MIGYLRAVRLRRTARRYPITIFANRAAVRNQNNLHIGLVSSYRKLTRCRCQDCLLFHFYMPDCRQARFTYQFVERVHVRIDDLAQPLQQLAQASR